MPRVFKMGPYLVYFWSGEAEPLEPVHVHVSDKEPQQNDTKIWLLESGHAVLCHNRSDIPERILNRIMDAVSARHDDVIARWRNHFGEVSYYC